MSQARCFPRAMKTRALGAHHRAADEMCEAAHQRLLIQAEQTRIKRLNHLVRHGRPSLFKSILTDCISESFPSREFRSDSIHYLRLEDRASFITSKLRPAADGAAAAVSARALETRCSAIGSAIAAKLHSRPVSLITM